METFEFNNQFVPQSLVDVDNPGNTALEASNDLGFYYYLVIRTILGTTEFITFGPIIPDIAELPEAYSFSYYQEEYNESKILKTIKFWLNDKNKKLTEAQTITFNQAVQNIVDMKKYLLDKAKLFDIGEDNNDN